MNVAKEICQERKTFRLIGMADEGNIGFYEACGFKHDAMGFGIHFKY